MKLLLDFFPILLFFGAYMLKKDMYFATQALMIATAIQVVVLLVVHRRLQRMHMFMSMAVFLFGGLTLYFHNDAFIKWKPTIAYGSMALALAIASGVFRKNLLESLLGGQLTLPHQVWKRLTLAWIGYFAFMAAFNAYMLSYSESAWMASKLWGYVFPIAFLVAQGIYIAPHIQTDQDTKQ